MEDRFVEANGIEIHYLDHAGNDPPLILLPGLTANANCFDGLIAAGLSPRFRVLALDLRGRGLSGKPATGYSIEDHAKDVIGFMDALGFESVVLAGHSFGGLVAMYMAAHYPERITRLIIMDAAAELHPDTPKLIQASLDRMGVVVPSWDAYISAVKQQPQYVGWWDEQIETFYRADVEEFEDGSVKSRLYPQGILEAAQKGLEVDWDAVVAGIQQPTILLNAPTAYGEGRPPIIPRDKAEATVAALANGRYIEIPGHHITMLYGKGAQRTVQVITEFVSELN